MLLDRGVDVDARDGCDWTALMLAVYAGHESMVRLLLRHGANPTLKTPKVRLRRDEGPGQAGTAYLFHLSLPACR